MSFIHTTSSVCLYTSPTANPGISLTCELNPRLQDYPYLANTNVVVAGTWFEISSFANPVCYQIKNLCGILYSISLLTRECFSVRIRANHILFCINALTLLLILIITFLPDNFLRIILGLPLVLFFPGYTLLAALFPRTGGLNNIERFALSFGLSIAVVPLIGLALNYTPWGIRLYPILISLSIFSFSMSVIGWYRSRRLPPDETIAFLINFKVPSVSQMWSSQSLRDKIITVVLVVMIIGAIGTLVYVVNQPRHVEQFTEFYVLNAEGKAENYPSTVFLGQSVEVILGIINHEHEATDYRIEIVIDGESIGQVGPVSLDADETWEQAVTATPKQKGDKQKLEFLLYKNTGADVYESLHLWIEVQ
ncbi:MAG: DUF1616 domain-containing protein [Dehalococcoidales bacterium]|nr:DUF1616 domain-containing protein [Dehalococcoidales bacterium]